MLKSYTTTIIGCDHPDCCVKLTVNKSEEKAVLNAQKNGWVINQSERKCYCDHHAYLADIPENHMLTISQLIKNNGFRGLLPDMLPDTLLEALCTSSKLPANDKVHIIWTIYEQFLKEHHLDKLGTLDIGPNDPENTQNPLYQDIANKIVAYQFNCDIEVVDRLLWLDGYIRPTSLDVFDLDRIALKVRGKELPLQGAIAHVEKLLQQKQEKSNETKNTGMQ